MKPCDMLSPEKIAETCCISPVFAERAAHRFFFADIYQSFIDHTKHKMDYNKVHRRNIMKRRVLREIAVQSLYQMEMNQVDSAEAVSMLLSEAAEENETERVIGDEAKVKEIVLQLVNGTWVAREEIDAVLTQYLKGWQVSRLSRVDRQILRLAAYELAYREDVPGKVAVNEAIELAKHFGTDESGKFVNGVLGRMLQELDEVKAKIKKT